MKSLIAERVKRKNGNIKAAAEKSKKTLSGSSKKRVAKQEVIEEKTIAKEPKTLMLDVY